VSGVAGQIEQQGHRLLPEDGVVGRGDLEGGSRLLEPVVEHGARQ
jgi:hypothetical protein